MVDGPLQQKATEFQADIEKKLQKRAIDKERTSNVLTAFKGSLDAILEDTSLDDAARAKKLDETKHAFDAMVDNMPGGSAEALRDNSDDFVRGVEAVAAGTESVESDESDESAEDALKAKKAQDRAKLREEYAKAQKKRDLKSALRAVSKEGLTVQKAKYEDLKKAGFHRRNGILEEINDVKKATVKKQLEVYEKSGINLAQPPEEYAGEVKALQQQLASLEGGNGSAEEPNMDKLKADMAKAKEIMEKNKPIVLKEPPNFENLGKNFAVVNEGQANIQQAASFLQASFAEASKAIAKGKQAADNYDLVDKLWPWDTDNNDKVNAANEALKDIQGAIRKEYNPLIADMDSYKATVLAAAAGLQSQAESFYNSKSQRPKDMQEAKNKALEGVQDKAAAEAQEKKGFFDLNVQQLQEQHEQQLKAVRDQKKEVIAMNEGQTAYIGNQKAILDEHGKQIEGQMFNHETAKQSLEETRSALQDKLREPGLTDEKRAMIEERLRIVETKKSEVEQSGTAYTDRLRAMGEMKGQLNVAGENVYNKAFFALNNLDTLENKMVVDFAQQIGGMRRQFAEAEILDDLKLESDVDLLSEDYDYQIEAAEEESKMAGDLKEEADLHYLELDVANAAALDGVKSQCNQLATQEGVKGGWLDSTWNSITLKRGFSAAYDLMGLSEDNWFRKHVDGIGAPLTMARDGIEAVAGWIDKKTGVSDWYHRTIEKAKDINIPVVGQLAEIGAAAVDFVVDLGAGVTQLAFHPVDSAKGIVDLVSSLDKLKEAGKALIEVDEFEKGNGFFAATKILGNVLLTATGAGAVGAGIKAAGTATSTLGKVGRFARVATVDFVKNVPRAMFETGKFLVKAPFKIARGALKITVGAAKGGLTETIATMRAASRSAKILALDAGKQRFAKELGKIDASLDATKLEAAFAAHPKDLAAAMAEMENGITFASGAKQAYARVAFARYFQNAERLRVLTTIDDAVNAVKVAKIAPAITDAAFSLEKVSLDDYAKLAKRYKNVDDLAVAILSDNRFALDVKNVAHVEQAKAMAKMVSENGGEGLRRYLKVLTEPVLVDDLITHYGTKPEAAKLGKIKAESGVIAASTDAKYATRVAEYRVGEKFVDVKSLEDLAMRILENWDIKDPITRTTTPPKARGKKGKKAPKPATTTVSHFENVDSIKLARGYAEQLLNERKVLLPTDATKLADLTTSLRGVDLLKAPSAVPASSGNILRWGAETRARLQAEMAALEASKGGLTSAIDRAKAVDEIFWKGIKVHAAWPVDKVGSLVASIPDKFKFIEAPLRYTFSAPLGAFVFTIDGTSRFGRALMDVFKANRETNVGIKARNAAQLGATPPVPAVLESAVPMLNGAGEIEFVARSMDELKYALMKTAILMPNIDEAKEKVALKEAKKPVAKETSAGEEAARFFQ